MRIPRIKASEGGYYHVMSRVVDRRMVMDDHEKERFHGLMRRVERFNRGLPCTASPVGQPEEPTTLPLKPPGHGTQPACLRKTPVPNGA